MLNSGKLSATREWAGRFGQVHVTNRTLLRLIGARAGQPLIHCYHWLMVSLSGPCEKFGAGRGALLKEEGQKLQPLIDSPLS